MKKDIHPKYYSITVKCICGKVYNTGSTKQDISIEICSNCHSFFTGKHKIVDRFGRVEKFKQKYEKVKAKEKI